MHSSPYRLFYLTKQTVQTLIKCCLLWHFIWVFTYLPVLITKMAKQCMCCYVRAKQHCCIWKTHGDFTLHTSHFIVQTSYFTVHSIIRYSMLGRQRKVLIQSSHFILRTSYFTVHCSDFRLHTFFSYFIVRNSYFTNLTQNCTVQT